MSQTALPLFWGYRCKICGEASGLFLDELSELWRIAQNVARRCTPIASGRRESPPQTIGPRGSCESTGDIVSRS